MAQAMQNGRSATNGKASGKKPAKPDEYFDKQMPFDFDAEVGVLGSMILLLECIDTVVDIISAEDFYDVAHQKLFTHLVAQYEARRIFDITLLIARIKTAGDYDAVGKTAYISKIINAVPNAAHAIHYAEIVRDKAIYRRLITSSTQTLQDAYDQSAPPADLVGQAETSLSRVSDSTIRGRDTLPFNTVIADAINRLDERLTNGRTRLLNVRLDAFSDCMGLVPGGLTIVGGRPSQGKTSVAVRMAANVCHDGLVVYFASLEMSAVELADRMLAAHAEVDCYSMIAGRLSCEQRDRLVESASTISQWRIAIDDSPTMTLAHISAAARRVRRRNERLDLIVIDYAQLIEPENRKDDRVEQLAKISRGSKRLARELQAPVVLVAQVNRDTTKNADNRPRLENLKGSGDFEQDADSVVFTHRPQWYLRNFPARGQGEDAELLVSKNRNGPLGDFETLFFGSWMDWRNKASARHNQESSDRDFR